MKAKSVRAFVSSVALVIGLVVLASPAFAQVAFTVSSLPQQSRFEGITETMGAVQATNNGAAGTIKNGSSVTVLYSGTIVAPGTAAQQQSVLSCSGIAGCAVAGTVTIGSVSGGQLTISFSADTAVPNGAFILVSQVRINVNSLGAATTTVTATLSGTSAAPQTNPLTFTNATVPVAAIVNPALAVTIAANVTPMQTCAIAASPFTITVTERYPAALTQKSDEANFTPGSYTVANGTSVVVTFTGVPSGLAIASTAATGPLGFTALAIVSTGPTSTLTFTFPTTGGSTSAVDTSTLSFSQASRTPV